MPPPWLARVPSFSVVLFLVLSASLTLLTSAQSTSPAAANSTISANVTVIKETSTVTSTTVSGTGSQALAIVTVFPTVVNVTLTIAPTPTPTSTSANASATVLDTKIDPAFGVLGSVLILTGIPSAFLGHKNRWSSFFLIGFYTLSLVCFSLIVKFGILHSINPPSKTLRGMFFLASFVAGVAGGGFAIFFWQTTKYAIGAWGGLAFGLWVQCFRDGGLIRPIGLRWVLFITSSVIGFVLCTIPKIHYQVLLVATAIVGASAIILGVDCFSTAGLKEFYVWNIGFRQLFPKYVDHGIQFPVSQTMQIEIGLIGAISLMGIAVQLRVLQVLQRKLREIKEEQKRRDRQDEAKAAERFANLEREKAEWEREHPSLSKHGRTDSEFSGTTLLRDSNFGTRPRRHSGMSEFLVAGPPEEELKRAVMKNIQSPGVLPVLDLGSDIKDDVPRAFVSGDTGKSNLPSVKPGDLRAREDLLQEIQTIRRSIEILKAETPQPSSGSSSRQPSLASRARTLSYDLNGTVLGPSHPRPPREPDPRARIQSMDLPSLGSHVGHSIGRPTSAPLRDDDWDSYLRDRKLLQPPSGVSAPIPTTSTPFVVPTPRVAVPAAVQDALMQRQLRESLLETSLIEGDKIDTPTSTASQDMVAVAPKARHRRASSNPLSTSYMPPTILPPRKVTPPPAQQPRTVTYEELTERHREKLHELQAPLTNAEKEQAELEAAKARWERSKTAERQAVAKRQAEKAAAAQAKESRRRRSEDTTQERNNTNKQSSVPRDSAIRHSRSRSADKLGMSPTTPVARSSSARLSMLKVEDWQRYQTEHGQSSSTPTRRNSVVPFPDSKGHESRQNRRASDHPRDPPN
ncbi:hypothetical protein F5148DRAFT_650634 [Russula earlei]|uniref:Uncharacterized protein n=1 Tax=Russula earlei TaxID=71964 RepID=A0ACC0UP33_9AGAM|nr:hypothetical protein F5148DRAFT_650634 [Russula earlei]